MVKWGLNSESEFYMANYSDKGQDTLSEYI